MAPVGRVAELGTEDGTREGASLENAVGLTSLGTVVLGANAGTGAGTSLENPSELPSPISSEDASMDVWLITSADVACVGLVGAVEVDVWLRSVLGVACGRPVGNVEDCNTVLSAFVDTIPL
jgi:hypothetical protein